MVEAAEDVGVKPEIVSTSSSFSEKLVIEESKIQESGMIL